MQICLVKYISNSHFNDFRIHYIIRGPLELRAINVGARKANLRAALHKTQ
jgi:hypothetical protein